MRVSRNERIKLELQMLTGIVTDDISYMCYLLLKDGLYFKNERDKELEIGKEEEQKIVELSCESFEDFFNSL